MARRKRGKLTKQPARSGQKGRGATAPDQAARERLQAALSAALESLSDRVLMNSDIPGMPELKLHVEWRQGGLEVLLQNRLGSTRLAFTREALDTLDIESEVTEAAADFYDQQVAEEYSWLSEHGWSTVRMKDKVRIARASRVTRTALIEALGAHFAQRGARRVMEPKGRRCAKVLVFEEPSEWVLMADLGGIEPRDHLVAAVSEALGVTAAWANYDDFVTARLFGQSADLPFTSAELAWRPPSRPEPVEVLSFEEPEDRPAPVAALEPWTLRSADGEVPFAFDFHEYAVDPRKLAQAGSPGWIAVPGTRPAAPGDQPKVVVVVKHGSSDCAAGRLIYRDGWPVGCEPVEPRKWSLSDADILHCPDQSHPLFDERNAEKARREAAYRAEQEERLRRKEVDRRNAETQEKARAELQHREALRGAAASLADVVRTIDAGDDFECSEVLERILAHTPDVFTAAAALLFQRAPSPAFVARALQPLVQRVTLTASQWAVVAEGADSVSNVVRDIALQRARDATGSLSGN